MSKAKAVEGGLEQLRALARKIFENLQRDPADKLMYRGVLPVSESDLSSAVRKQRPNSAEGAEWWSDNPFVAGSYGPLVRVARLRRDPELVLEAQGRNWDDYFLMPAPGGRGYSVRAGLRPGPFRSGFENDDVRDIMVRAIQDAGPHAWPRMLTLEREYEDLTGLPATWGSNLYVKPKSNILREVPPQLKARGGLAQAKERSYHG